LLYLSQVCRKGELNLNPWLVLEEVMSLKNIGFSSVKKQCAYSQLVRLVRHSHWAMAGLGIVLLANNVLVKAQTVTTLPCNPSGTVIAQALATPVAPDATGVGPLATTAAEYRFPATVDPDIISDE
jgi:hypothetical protein